MSDVDVPDRIVRRVYNWENGNVMVFCADGEQILELQGRASTELLERIRRRSDLDTEWLGFDESGPLEWP